QSIFIGNYVRGDDKETPYTTPLAKKALDEFSFYIICPFLSQIMSVISSGLLLEEEKEKLENIKLKYDNQDEIKTFRYNLQMVCNYDWVPLPLVYTQEYLRKGCYGGFDDISDEAHHWTEVVPLKLPFYMRQNLKSSQSTNPLVGSAVNAKLNIKEENIEMVVRMPKRRNAIDFSGRRRASSHLSLNIANVLRRRSNLRRTRGWYPSSSAHKHRTEQLKLIPIWNQFNVSLINTAACLQYLLTTNYTADDSVYYKQENAISARSMSLLPSMKLFIVEEAEAQRTRNGSKSSSHKSNFCCKKTTENRHSVDNLIKRILLDILF
uniref:Bestrophin homolog n=1 Tax=Parascaris equorum TaxID=6256 RepID=A0A914SCL7_PAREQ